MTINAEPNLDAVASDRGHPSKLPSVVVYHHGEVMTTIEQAIAEAQRNNRVCPQPNEWLKLYEMLPRKRREDGGWEPSLPLILAAWWDTPALSKMVRLREHIEWASTHGCLEQVYTFLRQLQESEWHHVGD